MRSCIEETRPEGEMESLYWRGQSGGREVKGGGRSRGREVEAVSREGVLCSSAWRARFEW
jgi:hypothetical protein